MPSTACYLHQLLNLSSKTVAFDLGQACAGYLYGLFVAHSLIQSGLGNFTHLWRYFKQIHPP